jgi:thiaminase
MTTEELIAKLPEEYQPIARRYVSLLLDMGFDELQSWIEILASGNWREAYISMVSKMSTIDILNEQEKVNEILKKLNKENANMYAAQKEMIQQIFLTSLLMVRKGLAL